MRFWPSIKRLISPEDKSLIAETELVYVLVLLATGIVVGFACGLLGVGGGFIMVPVQIWVLTATGIEPTIATRVAFGTSLAVVLPTALSGCHGHSCRGVVLWRPGIYMGLSGLFGAILGGTIASHAPADLLKTIFGLVVLAGALRMLLAGKIKPSSEPRSGLLQYIIWGFGVGIVSGLSGIGGGVILVPVMIMIMGFGILQAVGTSSVAIALNSVGGIISYAVNGWGVPGLPPYSIGYINLLQFGLLAGASVLTAQLGVRYAHRIPGELLRQIFIILMIIVGLDMLGIFSRIGLPK
jgi:uncharacterized membrane protein YfcA